MSNRPFASFCFSTYKRPAYLQSTLRRILMQTFVDFEVIVSDNDPGASGKDIVESFGDSRFKYFPNGENLGMKKSYNKSLERSSGEFIVMIADDDPVYPDMLMTLWALQKEYPGHGMYMGGCDWYCVDHKLGKLYNFKVGTNSCLSNEHDIDHKQVYDPGEFIQKIFAFEIFPHYLWSTAIVKRDILVKMGGVPEYGTPFLGDYAYMTIAASDSGCVIINRALGCQTLHDENFGRNQTEQILTAAKNFPAFIESKVGHLPQWPEIRKRMLRFTGLWVVSHMSFLYAYYKKEGMQDPDFNEIRKKLFKVDYLKKFRIKYFLKTKFPSLHNFIVNVKRSLI